LAILQFLGVINLPSERQVEGERRHEETFHHMADMYGYTQLPD